MLLPPREAARRRRGRGRRAGLAADVARKGRVASSRAVLLTSLGPRKLVRRPSWPSSEEKRICRCVFGKEGRRRSGSAAWRGEQVSSNMRRQRGKGEVRHVVAWSANGSETTSIPLASAADRLVESSHRISASTTWHSAGRLTPESKVVLTLWITSAAGWQFTGWRPRTRGLA
jgi:hypothetical protein